MLYRKGTITTNGTNKVTGVATYWASAVDRPAKGDLFTADFKTLYEIVAIDNDGSLTLDRSFEGANYSGSYGIIRNSSATTNTRIAQQVSETLNKLSDKITVSTTAPSAGQGQDGDIWFVVVDE